MWKLVHGYGHFMCLCQQANMKTEKQMKLKVQCHMLKLNTQSSSLKVVTQNYLSSADATSLILKLSDDK